MTSCLTKTGFGVASIVVGLLANLLLGLVLYFSNASKAILEKVGVKALMVKKVHRASSLVRLEHNPLSGLTLLALGWECLPFVWPCGNLAGQTMPTTGLMNTSSLPV